MDHPSCCGRRWVEELGEKRFKLDDIVGQQDGIGVENLRGSGLIAGETSAAYEDTFTLSSANGALGQLREC